MKLYIKYEPEKIQKFLIQCMDNEIDIKCTISYSVKYGTYAVIDSYFASMKLFNIIHNCGLEEKKKGVNNE